MANQASNLVKFDVAEGKIVISAQDMDYSMSGHETLTCQYEGENIAIGFKSPFVLEILSNIESEMWCWSYPIRLVRDCSCRLKTRTTMKIC